MERFDSIVEVRGAILKLKLQGLTLGFVPTMGALHEGHLELVRQAKRQNDAVLVSVFLNPTQFNDVKDYQKYPRDDARDLAMLESVGTNLAFFPTPTEIYPKGFDTVVTVRALSDRLEGQSRPGHFQGVSTVVTKLLNIAQADRAYFGEKDWQQLLIMRKLVDDLNIHTEVIAVPTVREADGLAMSSRNVRLTDEQRAAAKILSSTLEDVQTMADTGLQDAYQLAAWLHQMIAVNPLAEVEYAVVVDLETMQEVDTIERGALAAVAVRFGDVRLIDNRVINPPTGPAVRR